MAVVLTRAGLEKPIHAIASYHWYYIY